MKQQITDAAFHAEYKVAQRTGLRWYHLFAAVIVVAILALVILR